MMIVRIGNGFFVKGRAGLGGRITKLSLTDKRDAQEPDAQDTYQL